MFYYISFLRPPPLQASTTPTEPILITPQICNDLRTEYLDGPIDIYYAWSLHTPHPTSPTITKPAKLTSWRTSTAYEGIPVPRPPHLGGQSHKWRDSDRRSWRLILTCGTTPNDQAVVLDKPDTTGSTPFSVISCQFTLAKSTKQERIVRSYAVRAPFQDRPIVFDITEQTSFDLDKKIWDSGIGLGSWLVQLFSGMGAETGGTLSDLHESLFSTDARHILELGAGTGIVAITIAILRSTLALSDQPGSIVTTDLHNITSSRSLTSRCVPQPAVLDWEHEELPPQVQIQLEAGLDVIVMADVTYNTESFSALIGTLSRLIQFCKHKRNGRPPRVLMGYKERHPDERSLWDRAKDIGLHFQQIAQVNGAGGNPIRCWVYWYTNLL
ncbi:putative methyltransferase-domain-containing protein [Boletus coccyginus]|nr:putative methyltransferase-domain-containing protein [Boletus coccyginus]